MLSVRTAALGLVAVVVVAVACVPLGRWSSNRGRASQEAGIDRVFSATGPLDMRRLDAFRFTPAFDCLLFRNGPVPYALEVCFDSEGRGVEAVDRTAGYHWWSLRFEPTRAKRLLAPQRLDAIFRSIGADKAAHYTGAGIPLGISDEGPQLVTARASP